MSIPYYNIFFLICILANCTNDRQIPLYFLQSAAEIKNPETIVSGFLLIPRLLPRYYGADYEARTRYLHLGKVALYQMS